MNLIKKLIRSKTIWGIFTAAAGASINFLKNAFPEYAALIEALSATLSTSGLGLALYGRVKAEGPITNDRESN